MKEFYLKYKQLNLINELICEKINTIESPSSMYAKLNNSYLQELWQLKKSIDNLPIRILEAMGHCEFIVTNPKCDMHFGECSECKRQIDSNMNYCPQCGLEIINEENKC